MGLIVTLLACFAGLLCGCQITNNNLQVTTGIGKNLTGGKTTVAPLNNQQVSGAWDNDMPTGDPNNTVEVTPFGSVYNFSVITNPTYTVNDARMPAYWDFDWDIADETCYSSTAPYQQLSNPVIYSQQAILPTSYMWPGESIYAWATGQTPPVPTEPFVCWTNTPANPDFIPTEVSPQFALDNAPPSSIQVHAFNPVTAAASSTNLNLYNMSLASPVTVTAQSVASGGSSATFSYPQGLAAGAYITTITTITSGSGANLKTNGLEPFYVAHNDTTWTSAFGVDIAVPEEIVQTYSWGRERSQCVGPTITTTKYGGSTLPLVSLTSQAKLAVGSASNTVSVGQDPTVVIAYNSVPITSQVNGSCGPTSVTSYSGAQSALVVNTGSNSVSLVDIGEYHYPSGTVAVGSNPVAAAINPAGTMAYIANYGSSTISEINLSTVAVTRTLSVSTNPTSVAFDSSGNLWVGGRGFLEEVSLTNWTVQTSPFAIDGTITGMTYDPSQSGFVATFLKNGSASNPINGITNYTQIAFSNSINASYSTTALLKTSTGAATVESVTGDNAPYAGSTIASSLAFAGQTAFNPPIYPSTSDDYIASANGNTFTVSLLSSGKVLLKGSMPYPIRGIKLTTTNLYLTMPESNSLVTLPIQLP